LERRELGVGRVTRYPTPSLPILQHATNEYLFVARTNNPYVTCERIMSSSLDSFIDDLQDQVFEDARSAFGEKVYQRWRQPLYMLALNNPDGHANLKGGCGDSIEVFLKFENNRVAKASFLTDGCGPSVVCGSYAVEMALGKTAEELLEIDGNVILNELGGLPEENEHCAYLAAESLHAALDDYMRRQV
jgi:nitrogen fixation NifU-like protein